MKNIHILPTDKPTGIFKSGDNLLFSIINKVRTIHEGFHIYITNDEDIKEGDWFIDEFGITKNDTHLKFIGKKIILTTDGDLIKDGVQSIDDVFLEWFVKNPSCEEVKTEYGCCGQCDERLCEVFDLGLKQGVYKIIIPKEEPKNVKGGDDIVFPEREVKFEDVFNDEKKEGLKQFIQDYKEKPWRDFEVEYNAFINSGGLNGETGEGWINHSKLIPWLKENYIITKKN